MIILIGAAAVFTAPLIALAVAVRNQQRRFERARTATTLDEMSGWVNSLVLRYAPGGCLTAVSNDGPGFLLLGVTGREADWRRVEFGLPDAEWSRESFALAVATLEEGAAESHLEHDPGNADEPRFLWVTLTGQQDAVALRATDLLRRAAGVLSFPPGGTYTMSLTGREHPEYLRTVAAQVEAHTALPRWLGRRLGAFVRREAEALERA
jgi:hypothetical protein